MCRELTLALALLSLGGMAAALEPSPAPSDGALEARQAFAQGTAFFNLGQWDRAVEAWERGYRLKSDAVFLYNIGQAHRLADRPERALFFYRNYLRTAVDAPNRSEVEQRIAQLEKAVTAREAARETLPGTPLPGTPLPSVAPTQTPPAPAPAPMRARRLSLRFGLGPRLWAAGVSASPSLTLGAGAGYDVIRRGRWALRIGGDIGYSYLKDIDSIDHFISIIATPGIRIRLWRERLYFLGELGLGVQVVAGLTADSALVAPSAKASVAGLFLLRPLVALQAQLTPAVSLWLAPAFAYSPLPSRFAARALCQADLLVGVGARP